MLNHPDSQVQYIFTTLENQRDNVMIENGNLCVRVQALEAEVESLKAAEMPATVEDAPSKELPVN